MNKVIQDLKVGVETIKKTQMKANLGNRKLRKSQAVVAHACNPSTLGGKGRRISEFEASLVYRVSSRKARATQRYPVYKQTNKTKQKKSCAQVKLSTISP